jgi:hypothetical protein
VSCGASSVADGLSETSDDERNAEPGTILDELPGVEESEQEEDQGCNDTGGYGGSVGPKYVCGHIVVCHCWLENLSSRFVSGELARKCTWLESCVLESSVCLVIVLVTTKDRCVALICEGMQYPSHVADAYILYGVL